MNTITIKPLSSEINKDYLDFFDTRAFTDGNPNGPCYCTSPNQDEETIKKMVKKFKIYAEEGISGHERTEDVGLMINIFDGEYKAYFALRSTDQCMSSFRILPLSLDYQKEHPLSLKNPINQILIEMIDKNIVLK